VVVPVEVASDKAESAARTLRPKIRRHLDDYLADLRPTPIARDSLGLENRDLDLDNPDSVLTALKLDRSVPPVPHVRGGTSEAKGRLRHFLGRGLDVYAEIRNRPEIDGASHMSAYLHFGQISPVYIALQARGAAAHGDSRASYLEELVVRRELAYNFVHYT